MDEHCERLLRGRCCKSRGGRSAQYKLWARLLEPRRSDLCREEQSWLVPQKIPSPFPWLGVSAPLQKGGERCVAVATDLLHRAVALFCRSDGYTALLWLDSAQCPHPISRQAEPRAIEAPLHRQLCQLRCNSVVTALTSAKSRYLLRNRRQGDPLQLYRADHLSQAHHPLVGTCLY